MFFEHSNVAGSPILERPTTQVHSSDVLASAGEQAKLKETEALELNGKGLTVGRERHRFYDPLFDPRVPKHVPLWR